MRITPKTAVRFLCVMRFRGTCTGLPPDAALLANDRRHGPSSPAHLRGKALASCRSPVPGPWSCQTPLWSLGNRALSRAPGWLRQSQGKPSEPKFTISWPPHPSSPSATSLSHCTPKRLPSQTWLELYLALSTRHIVLSSLQSYQGLPW